MSSKSSYSGGSYNISSLAIKNTSNITINPLKIYLCPKCNHSFDIILRNNVYVGRVPLVLKCNHSICEECIRLSLNINRTIVCGECQEEYKVDTSNRKIQEIFPVNFYLLGRIYYSKPNMTEGSNLSVKPVGVKYKDRLKLEQRENNLFDYQLPEVKIDDEPCSQEKCNKPSTLSCLDCNEVFCDLCSERLHKSARGLQSHNIIKKAMQFVPELATKCPTHKDSVLEFQCVTCNILLCCYCTLLNHNTHNYRLLSSVEDSNKVKFADLIQKAEETMKKLMVAHKRVLKEMSSIRTNNQITSIEVTIGKFFANVHAQLQAEESKWLKEVSTAKNYNSIVLCELNNDVFTKIRSLTNLITMAKNLQDPDSNVKVNARVLTERLENALNDPCYFVGKARKLENMKFNFNDDLVSLKGKFSINIEQHCGYRLVVEDEIDEDYEASIREEIASMNLNESLNQSSSPSSKTSEPCSPSETLLKPLMSVNVQKSVEGWVEQTCEEKFVRPNLKQGNREKVTVTHIDNPDSFYVQLTRCDKVFRNFSKKINLYVKHSTRNVAHPELNNLYIVKYQTKETQAGYWYRARVVDIIENEEEGYLYNVMFVDYGNSQVVKLNMLREISQELSRPRPFAFHCKLSNVYPKSKQWEPKAILLMVQIINGTDVVLVVMEDSNAILEVDLLSNVGGDEMASLRDALIFIGHGVPSLDAAGPMTELKMKSVIPVSKIHKRTENFTKGQILQVLISHVVNPHQVYVQVADFVHHIDHLSDVMESHYYTKPNKGHHANKSNHQNVYVPKRNMLVAVQQNRGSSLRWCRAVVVDVLHGHGLVEVYLVDYGNTMTVSYTQIKKLPEKFRRLDSQALLIKMVDVEPSGNDWGTDVNDFLNRYVSNKDRIRLVVAEEGDIAQAVLFESYASYDVCINALIVNEGYAMSTGQLSEKIEWMKEEKQSKKDDCYSFSLMKTIQGTRKQPVDDAEESSDTDSDVPRKLVNVLSSKNPSVIYVAFDDEESKKLQLQLHYSLQTFYANNRLNLSNPEIGAICVAFNSIKSQYFRAVILEKLDNYEFNVILRDVAEEIKVSAENLFVLDRQFKQYCEGAIRCHLAGIVPAGDITKWSGLSIEYLNDVFKNSHQIYLAKNGLVDKERKSLPVIMWYAEFKAGGALEPAKTILHNINKLLINKGLALKDRQFNNLLETSSVNSSPPKQENELRNNLVCEDLVVNTTPTIKSPVREVDHDKILMHFLPKSKSLDFNNKPVSNSSEELLSCRSTPPDVSKDWNNLIEEEICPVDWIPPQPFSRHKFEAFVTYVDYGGNIYLHEDKFDIPLREMEEEIQKVFCDLPPEPVGSIWIPGQLCTVKYYLTQQWHRGKILTVNDGTIRVYMIDYGNSEDCTHDDLRFKVMYLNIAAFANRVHLNNIPRDHKWLTSDLDELHKMVVDNKVTVHLKGKNIQNASIPATIYLDDINVNQAVVKFSSDMTSAKQEIDSDNTNDDVVVEEEQLIYEDGAVIKKGPIKPIKPTFPKFIQNPIPASFKSKQKSVGIISIKNFNRFILEIVSSKTIEETKNLFEKISNEIKECAHEQQIIDDVQIGQACIALFSEDDTFYRGQVMDKRDDGSVSIWFVDFGNFEDVSLDCIREIKPEWLTMPLYQHEAQVFGIELVDQNMLPEVFDRMSQLCDTAKTAKFVSTDPLIVCLYDDNNELCYQNLIDENLLRLQNA